MMVMMVMMMMKKSRKKVGLSVHNEGRPRLSSPLPIVWPASYWWWIGIGWRFNPRSPLVLLSRITIVLLTCSILVLLPTVLMTLALMTISHKRITWIFCFRLTKHNLKDVSASKNVNIFIYEDLYVLYIFHDKGVMCVFFFLILHKRLNYINVVIQLFSRHIYWQRRQAYFGNIFLCMWYRAKWIL